MRLKKEARGHASFAVKRYSTVSKELSLRKRGGKALSAERTKKDSS
jgi:hypothetical protein